MRRALPVKRVVADPEATASLAEPLAGGALTSASRTVAVGAAAAEAQHHSVDGDDRRVARDASVS